MTRLPMSAMVLQTAGSSTSKNCPSSMPTTSVSSSTRSSRSRDDARLSDGMRISLCEMMWSPPYRSSSAGLKIWTFRFAICARRRRRISSSLLPLNILPVITSIQPWFGRWWMMSINYADWRIDDWHSAIRDPPPVNRQSVNPQSINRQSVNPQSINRQSVYPQSANPQSANPQSTIGNPQSRTRQILPRVGADAYRIARVDERRDLDDEPRLEARGFHLRAGGGAVDSRNRLLHAQIHRHGQ